MALVLWGARRGDIQVGSVSDWMSVWRCRSLDCLVPATEPLGFCRWHQARRGLSRG